MVPYRVRPGAGFVVLTLCAAGFLALITWGLMTPRLDRVWRLQIELRLGQRAPLAKDELELLQDALCAYPELAESFIDSKEIALVSKHRKGVVENGYAYLVRKKGSSSAGVRVGLIGSKKDDQLSVRVRTVDETSSHEVVEGSPLTFAPREARCATVIEVLVSTKHKKKSNRSAAVVTAMEQI